MEYFNSLEHVTDDIQIINRKRIINKIKIVTIFDGIFMSIFVILYNYCLLSWLIIFNILQYNFINKNNIIITRLSIFYTIITILLKTLFLIFLTDIWYQYIIYILSIISSLILSYRLFEHNKLINNYRTRSFQIII